MTMPADTCLNDCPDTTWCPGCAACPCVATCDPGCPVGARPAAVRFVVRELGPRWFVVDDTVTTISYDMRFTRKGAQEAADWRNSRA
jgi:hypothetical protein